MCKEKRKSAGSLVFGTGFGSLGQLVHFFQQVDDADAAGGGVVAMEAEHGGGLEDHSLHDLALDGAVVTVKFVDDRAGVAAEYAGPDFAFFEVLCDFHFGDSHEFAVPLVIFLDDVADFAAEQFVDSIKTAGHIVKLLVFSVQFSVRRKSSSGSSPEN
jgi:hypothetical protein